MRRRLLVAALLSTTAIVRPEPANAASVGAFISGVIAASTPVYLGGATVAGFGAGVAFGSTALGAFVVNTVVSLGLSAIANALRPTPDLPTPADRMANFAQPLTYMEWAFGRTRKGGPLGFTGFADKRRWYVPILAAHSIAGVVEHWIDEWTVGVDGTATSYTDANLVAAGYSAPDVAEPYGRIMPFLGQPGQAANAGLVASFPEVTTDFDFKGLAGGVIWARKPPSKKFTAVYPRSRQWAWAPVIDGHDRIYDPRDDSYKHTANAALVMAYWLTEILGQSVDWSDVATEADVCDEQVVTAEGDSIARWEINGVISDDQDFEQQRAQMAGACDAFFFERPDGRVGFRVGRWIEPTVTLTADNFLSLEVTEGQWGANAPTEGVATYVEPQNNWRETPSGVWVEESSVKRQRDTPQLYLVRYHNQAARVLKRLVRAQRPQYQIRGTLDMDGYELIGERFARLQHPELGIDVYVEVGKLRRTGIGTWELEGITVAPQDWSFDAATEEPERPTYNSVTSTDGIDTISGLTVTAIGNGAIEVDWSPADESYAQQIRSTAPDGSKQIYNVPDEQRPFRISGLADGEDYDIEARNQTGAGRTGAWSSPVTITVVGDSTPPSALETFATSVSGSDVTASWTPPSSAHFAGVRIWRGTSTSFGDATLVRTEWASTGETSWTDTGLSAGDYAYWAAPINASGVEGPLSGPSEETIT